MKKHYYIYVTKDCNLNCDYCSGISINKNQNICTTNPYDLKTITKFVLQDSYDRELGKCNGNIYFYGGEPLMNQAGINEFINLTKNRGLIYISYTNGTLLDTIEKPILDNLDYLFVSIDGNEICHNKHRGSGTFKKIVRNYSKTRPIFRGKTLARLTITSENQLFNAVTELVDKFDYIYWQLQNNSNGNGFPTFQERYFLEVEKLVNFWINRMQKGEIINLIPFQVVSDALLSNKKQEFFPCGFGSSLVVIDLDGGCYLCDEMMYKQNKIGDVYNGVNLPSFKSHSISERCKECDISFICGGRCARMHIMFSNEAIEFYCKCTKSLYACILKAIPEIKKLIHANVLRKEDIADKMDFVENIP